jgi:low affinity Fe/Cu permease
MSNLFRRISVKVSNATGKASTFVIAICIVIIWGSTGPIFDYSDTWQLIINTGTTIVTFLMVFLIQNTQNRDSKSLHLKLDELIRAQKAASNAFLDLDIKTDEELDELAAHFALISSRVSSVKKEREEKEKLSLVGRLLTRLNSTPLEIDLEPNYNPASKKATRNPNPKKKNKLKKSKKIEPQSTKK